MAEPKKIVEDGYDELAESYMAIRCRDAVNRKYFDMFLEAHLSHP